MSTPGRRVPNVRALGVASLGARTPWAKAAAARVGIVTTASSSPASGTAQNEPAIAPIPAVSNGVAAIMSLMLPGLGQLAQRRLTAAAIFCVLTFAAYSRSFVAGLVMHIACVISAARYRPKGLVAG